MENLRFVHGEPERNIFCHISPGLLPVVFWGGELGSFSIYYIQTRRRTSTTPFSLITAALRHPPSLNRISTKEILIKMLKASGNVRCYILLDCTISYDSSFGGLRENKWFCRMSQSESGCRFPSQMRIRACDKRWCVGDWGICVAWLTRYVLAGPCRNIYVFQYCVFWSRRDTDRIEARIPEIEGLEKSKSEWVRNGRIKLYNDSFGA